jgi:hypothetical protein
MKCGNIGMKILKKLENNLLESSVYLCNCLQYYVHRRKQTGTAQNLTAYPFRRQISANIRFFNVPFKYKNLSQKLEIENWFLVVIRNKFRIF